MKQLPLIAAIAALAIVPQAHARVIQAEAVLLERTHAASATRLAT